MDDWFTYGTRHECALNVLRVAPKILLEIKVRDLTLGPVKHL